MAKTDSETDNMSSMQKIGTILSEGLMAFGQGMTGQPYYSNYLDSQNKRLQMEAEAKRYQIKQEMEARNRALQSEANVTTTKPNMLGYDESTGMNVVRPNPSFSPNNENDTNLNAEKRTYAYQGLLPTSRTDLLQMSPIERMNYLRGPNVKTSPTGTKYELGPAESRRQESLEMNKINSYGRQLSGEDKKSVRIAESAIGMSLPDAAIAGRADIVRTAKGEKYKVLSEREWANRKKMPSKTETDDINNRYDVSKSFKNVATELEKLGDLPSDSKVNFEGSEKVNIKGVGMVSIPARLSFVGQLSKDPKYTAIRRELETAFQAWRKVVTGAQASYQELKYLREAFPQLTDQPEVFKATVKNIMERNGRELETRFNTWSDVGRDVSELRERYENEYKPLLEGSSSDAITEDDLFSGVK